MKIRWSEKSIRFRITPTELRLLLDGKVVEEKLELGSLQWTARLECENDTTKLIAENVCVTMILSQMSLSELSLPESEGVYFCTDDGIRYFVEKDFPCAHPHSEEACEEPTERFAPTLEFAKRKTNTLLCDIASE